MVHGERLCRRRVCAGGVPGASHAPEGPVSHAPRHASSMTRETMQGFAQGRRHDLRFWGICASWDAESRHDLRFRRDFDSCDSGAVPKTAFIYPVRYIVTQYRHENPRFKRFRSDSPHPRRRPQYHKCANRPFFASWDAISRPKMRFRLEDATWDALASAIGAGWAIYPSASGR